MISRGFFDDVQETLNAPRQAFISSTWDKSSPVAGPRADNHPGPDATPWYAGLDGRTRAVCDPDAGVPETV
jgi:hypothetical protein